MPTYEYKCTACGHTFEKFQSITSEPTRRCPQCGKAKAKRLISAGVGLIFKGSGFYITDYRDATYKDKAKADSGAAAPAGEGSGDSKAETKAEGKGEGKGESKAGGESANTPAATPAESKPAAPKSERKPSTKNDGKSSKKKQ